MAFGSEKQKENQEGSRIQPRTHIVHNLKFREWDSSGLCEFKCILHTVFKGTSLPQVLLVQGILKRGFTFVYISVFVPVFTIRIGYSEQSILEKANPNEKGLFCIEVSTSEACTFADSSVFLTFSRVRLGILLSALRHYRKVIFKLNRIESSLKFTKKTITFVGSSGQRNAPVF